MPPEAQETFARVSGNFEYWLAYGMLPLSLYEPKIETLRKGKPRIVIGLGEQSKGSRSTRWEPRSRKSSGSSR